MNRDDIIRWMKDAGAGRDDLMPTSYDGAINVFAKVVESAVAFEREACANLCDHSTRTPGDCADAIRARGAP